MVNIDQKLNEFKECGSKVRVNHYRLYLNIDTTLVDEKGIMKMWVEKSHKELRDMREKGEYDSSRVSNKGGRTTIELTLPDGTNIKTEARCCEKDNFCRRTGKAICYGRLIKQYNKWLAASPEAKKYGNSQGQLLTGSYYLVVIDEVVYEVYPEQKGFPLEVIESVLWNKAEFDFALRENNIQELKLFICQD